MVDRVAAEVWLWEKRVGAVAEDAAGRVAFQYDPEFLAEGWEISPVHLARATIGRAPVVFAELAKLEAFHGLPGVIADALPDRFGNAIITKYFADRGAPAAALSAVQRLLYVGHRALGALEFRPALRRPVSNEEQLPLHLAELVVEARAVIGGRTDAALPDIMRIGASAGGARAKAVVLWNQESGALRSDFAARERGDERWIIKFDGTGEGRGRADAPKPFNRIEAAYAAMAREAGLDVAQTTLLRDEGYAHLMSRRFDRAGDEKLHLHSLGGLQHVDYNMPGAYSYEGLVRTVLALGLDYPTVTEAYRRAVFNIAMVNQDDHVKNISFLMNREKGWRLAPAYDLTFAKGGGYTKHHQMSVGGRVAGITRSDLLELGKFAGVRKRGADVIDAMLAVRERWGEFAEETGVPRADVRRVLGEFPELRK